MYKKNINRFINKKSITLVLIVFSFYLLGKIFFFGNDSFAGLKKSTKRLLELEKDNVLLKEESEKLQLEIKSIKNDLTRLEKIAREKLFYQKEGESIIYFVDEKEESENETKK